MMYGGAIFIASCFLFSIFISGCHGCPKGYHGSPCTKRQCSPLPVPSNGVLMGVCDNYYGSLCVTRCNEGYEAVGSRERKCDVNANNVMMWTGSMLQCAVIRCPIMAVPNADPPTGICTTYDLVYKSRCTFSCRHGYRLMGSMERVCELDKSWSGGSTSCVPIQCPKLPLVQAGVILVPSTCATGPVMADMNCQYLCPSGYSMQDDPSSVYRTLTCQLDGTWSTSVPTCRDTQRPMMTCPDWMHTNTLKGKATAKFTWTIEVTDNSVDVDPNAAAIVVRSSHVSGQEFPIGQTMIYVNATDKAGNMDECNFGVAVRDIEPPTCSFCPADIVIEAEKPQVRVNWELPRCSDNSGIPPSIQGSRQSGDLFAVPGSYNIWYTVSDQSNNVNWNCKFTITLKVKTCPTFPPPRNGALACTSHDSPFCAAMCKTGTDFDKLEPSMLYYCSNGQWELFFRGQKGSVSPWPNCSGNANPSWLTMSGFGSYYYYGGDAHDPKVQEAIKDKFHSLVTGVLPVCSDQSRCTKDSISVSPGVID